jgi:hypothetical protein
MKVFIQSNESNYLNAKISEYSFSKFANIDISIMNVNDFKYLCSHNNKQFNRGSDICEWRINSMVSFFPTRFFVNDLFRGECLIIDPDIFCVKDPKDLLNDIDSTKLNVVENNNNPPYDFDGYHSSVMYVDTNILSWDEEKVVNDMFDLSKDFDDYMRLYNCDVNLLEENKYQSFDKITDETIFIHMTRSETQPWKTGLRYKEWELHNRSKNFGGKFKVFEKHQSEIVENFFFQLSKEALECNFIDENMINEHIDKGNIRQDYWSKI